MPGQSGAPTAHLQSKAIVETGGQPGDSEGVRAGRGYFDRAGVANRITIKVGDALELLSEQTQEFDIIFCDVDKEDYPRAFRVALQRLRKGGLFVADNVLWSGRIFDANDHSADTEGIREMTRLLSGDPAWTVSIIPIRDGVLIARKA